jgi:AcrR family transcriptional regulator
MDALVTQLSQARIVEAALAVIDERGLENLTMRALAERLDVTATALYYHFENRDALLEAIVEHETSRLVTTRDTSGPWEQQLRQLLTAMARELTAHPDLGVWIITNQARQHSVLDVHEAVLAILLDAGFEPAAAVEVKGVVFRYLIGHLILAAAPEGPHWRRLPKRYEHLRATGPAHDEVDRDALYEHGLDAIIAGLRP